MDYNGFSIEVSINPSASRKVRDVSYRVRRAGESEIVFHGLIAREFESENEAIEAALRKSRELIDDRLSRG